MRAGFAGLCAGCVSASPASAISLCTASEYVTLVEIVGTELDCVEFMSVSKPARKVFASVRAVAEAREVAGALAMALGIGNPGAAIMLEENADDVPKAEWERLKERQDLEVSAVRVCGISWAIFSPSRKN
jgi:hypothetical protein